MEHGPGTSAFCAREYQPDPRVLPPPSLACFLHRIEAGHEAHALARWVAPLSVSAPRCASRRSRSALLPPLRSGRRALHPTAHPHPPRSVVFAQVLIPTTKEENHQCKFHPLPSSSSFSLPLLLTRKTLVLSPSTKRRLFIVLSLFADF